MEARGALGDRAEVIAVSEAVWVALIGAIALVLVGVVAGIFQLAAVSKKLDTGNGHSIGSGVANTEARLATVEKIATSTHLGLVEHLNDVAPLDAYVRGQMEEDAS